MNKIMNRKMKVFFKIKISSLPQLVSTSFFFFIETFLGSSFGLISRITRNLTHITKLESKLKIHDGEKTIFSDLIEYIIRKLRKILTFNYRVLTDFLRLNLKKKKCFFSFLIAYCYRLHHAENPQPHCVPLKPTSHY